MKIATWNVNSIRTRKDHIVQWLQTNPVDILCLQETKVIDKDFPRPFFEDLGYEIYIYGQKAYNGVAILSKIPLDSVYCGFSGLLNTEEAQQFDEQKRVLTGIINGMAIVNLYVPNGSSIDSDKYQYKLNWLNCLKDYLKILLTQTEKICICGDFNIALEDIDIHNPKNRETHIMASDAERQALQSILELGFQDAFRKFTTEGGQFSWWDYRQASFRRNTGWRIDTHYLTLPLYEVASNSIIDKIPRTWEQPSDHTPVILTLDLITGA
ncbi:Exodeoxyribonuclease III [Planktothrix tepida]|uniref:Exodeoxyribonuclease III xth n=2 Tax=Planktothrix TaxID=54304 RepID=A0A1J1LK32_9CYAN|nr:MULTISPECIES: exodeoxyribonuclease III [Planktothrix]CAD5918169.1 Exodeoxyribonuclease III [Planktothrix pseudagardhii]CAD5982271.1 Exodeoxyribonuclease III [Planktothrix tepida]CUR31945.1 Exodeoxyribonuclease III xth [Planktothrix tepida PCC 9214]